MRDLRLCIALLVTLPLFGGDANDVVRDFITAEARGDLAHAASLVATDGVNRFLARAERIDRARCVMVRDVALRLTGADATSAVVEADVDVLSWGVLQPTVPQPARRLLRFDLVRADDVWRIRDIVDREEQLADAIMAANPELREQLVSEPGRRSARLAMLLVKRAMTFVNQDKLGDATALIAYAEAIADESGDAAAIAEAMCGRSVLFRYGVPNFDEALKVGASSLVWAEGAGDADVLARANVRYGRALSLVMGRPVTEPHARAASLVDVVSDLTPIALAHTALAEAADHVRDHRGAFRHSLLALQYAERSGEPAPRLNAMFNLAGAYSNQGDSALAAVHYGRAADFAREVNYPSFEASARLAEAKSLLAWDTDKFHEVIDRTLALVSHSRTEVLQETLLARASFRLLRGNFDAAEADANAVLAKALEQGFMRHIVSARNHLAAVRLRRGDCEDVLRIVDLVPANWGTKGQALRCLGRLEEAAAKLKEGLASEEMIRSGIVGTVRQRWIYQDGAAGLYTELADVLVDLGKIEEALRTVERLKGRVLMEILRGEVTVGAELTAEQREQNKQLEERLISLNKSILSSSGQAVDRLRVEVAATRLAMDDLAARAKSGVITPAPEPALNFEELRVPDGIVVVEYLVTDKRTLAFVVERNASGNADVFVHVAVVNSLDLQQKVEAYLSQITSRDLRAAATGYELYRLLLEPVMKRVGANRTLCVIPDGDLWKLPFQALTTGRGTYLIDRMPVLYAPSLAALSMARERLAKRMHDPERLLLAVANPNLRAKTVDLFRSLYPSMILGALPDTIHEVQALQRIYGDERSDVLLGEEARESVLKRVAGQYRIVHIASHSIVDSVSPMFSGLVLSAAPDDVTEDGLLDAREIAELDLNTEIAVLSACDSARGRIVAGEGYVGLAWAFLAAGVPTTVVSQWKTESRATAELMIQFHRRLSRGARPASALRDAARELRKNPRYSHPLYWAPFTVVGGD